MPAPYHTDEIASAVTQAAREAGLPIRRLEVVADQERQVWIIRASGASGEEHRMTFPFATALGIYTPAEIAAHLTRRSWPFG